MKIQFKEAKKYVTVAEMPVVRRIIEDFRENDANTPTDYAEYAARAITHNTVRILEAKAEICKNDRAWNRFSDDSEHLDVWITFTAAVGLGSLDGFIIGGACLSDIWDLTGYEETDAERVAHMSIRRFKETN